MEEYLEEESNFSTLVIPAQSSQTVQNNPLSGRVGMFTSFPSLIPFDFLLTFPIYPHDLVAIAVRGRGIAKEYQNETIHSKILSEFHINGEPLYQARVEVISPRGKYHSVLKRTKLTSLYSNRVRAITAEGELPSQLDSNSRWTARKRYP